MTLPPTAAAALAAMRARELSAEELVRALLRRADELADLGAWLHLDRDGAVEAARGADIARAAGDDRPLLGLPLAVKDIIDVGGLPTTGGSDAWRRDPLGDAACVAAVRAAGAIVLGKAHTNEFAFGIDGRNPHHPPCRNPHDPERLTGGSSSGPAVAVAAGMALGGIGSDTSGSVRVPPAFCGCVGLRATPGRIPLDGVLALAPSYDVAGPIAVDERDAALLFAAMAGPPPRHPITPPQPRVGLVEELLEQAHPDVTDAVSRYGRDLEAAGARVEPVSLPALAHALDVHRVVQLYEAARVHAGRGEDLARLAPDVRERIAQGFEITEEEYVRARADRARIARALVGALRERDALLAPAAPVVAPRRDAETVDLGRGRVRPVRDALLSCVVPTAQAPLPALAVPAGRVDGLPVGAQLIGRTGADEALLELSARVRRP